MSVQRLLAIGCAAVVVASCGRFAPFQPADPSRPSSTPHGGPGVSSLTQTLAAPVTTYSINVVDPGNGQMRIVWVMEGEACGSPKVPWTQEGPLVAWSHSGDAPDSCSHSSTSHNVTTHVNVTILTGPNQGAHIECHLFGTETESIDVAKDCFGPNF